MKKKVPLFFMSLFMLHFPALFALGAPESLAEESEGYLWPVKDRPEVTSVFCDHRQGHPHGGIDISLFGKTGVTPIVSVGKGVLMRIRSSKVGYGNAVYILMDGGKVAVYAHLDRFSPKLEEAAREIRQRTGLARLNYYYEKWEMNVAVERGELIGFGGNTGTTTPHLHFEIRQDDLVNLNPLTNGFPIQDTVAPTIHGVLFVPVDPGASVAGGERPRAYASGALSRAGPIAVRGRVGLAVDAGDRHRPGGRVFSPYSIRLLVDGEEFFETRYEQWGYVDNNIQITQYATGKGGKRYMRVHNPFPVDIPFFSGADAGFFDQLSDGLHQAELIVADAAGHEDRLAFSLQVEAARSGAGRPWPRGRGQRLFNKEVLEIDEAFAMVGGEFSFFEPVLVDVHKAEEASRDNEGPCYRLAGPDLPLRRSFGLRFRYENDEVRPDRLGVYRREGSTWRFLGGDWDPFARSVSGDSDGYGLVCLLRDEEAPSVTGIQTPRRGPQIRFRVADTLSGVGRDGLRVWIGGKRALVDFERRTGETRAEAYWPLASGRHEVVIRATDRMGNETTRTLDLVVP